MERDIKGLWIDGEWVYKTQTYPLRSPYSGKLLAKISMATVEDVKRAIRGAVRAYERMRQCVLTKGQSCWDGLSGSCKNEKRT